MIPRRYRVLFWAVPVLVVQWIVIAAIELDGPGRYEYVTVGFFFGSFYGHATLAAAWAALGPGPIAWRVPLSLVWLAMLPVAIAINLAINDGPNDGAMLIFLAVAAVIVTLPLLLAGLLPRWAIPAVLFVLALIAFATAWEVTLLQTLAGAAGSGPETGHFIGINALTSVTILGGVLLLRLNGYGMMDPEHAMNQP